MTEQNKIFASIPTEKNESLMISLVSSGQSARATVTAFKIENNVQVKLF